MVLVLEERLKIEADRNIMRDDATHERFEFVQKGSNEKTIGPEVVDFTQAILRDYTVYARRYAWHGHTITTLMMVAEAVANAMLWGNQRTPGKKIKAEVEYGLLGSAIFIQDDGRGFDYAAAIEKLRHGERYYLRQGSGLKRFDETPLHIAYHDHGTLISIATPPISMKEATAWIHK